MKKMLWTYQIEELNKKKEKINISNKYGSLYQRVLQDQIVNPNKMKR